MQTCREHSKARNEDAKAVQVHHFPPFLSFLTSSQPCFRTTKWAHKCGKTREEDAPQEHPCGRQQRHACSLREQGLQLAPRVCARPTATMWQTQLAHSDDDTPAWSLLSNDNDALYSLRQQQQQCKSICMAGSDNVATVPAT